MTEGLDVASSGTRDRLREFCCDVDSESPEMEAVSLDPDGETGAL